jgi:4-hydroxy-tetrahydrodipicolinate synthase
MRELGQLITAMVTPFNDKLEVDYNKAAKLAEYLVENGSDGILVVGTTGESPTLTHEEKLELFRVVKKTVGSKVSIIAGTGTNNTRGTIEFTKEAEQIGVDAALVVCPYYNKPPQEGIYQHYKMVADATSLPIIVYNIQGRTGVNITPDTMEKLSKIPNVIADKEASGNIEQCNQIVIQTGAMKAYKKYLPVSVGVGGHQDSQKQDKLFYVYSGDDSLVLPMMSVGAMGVISVASHVVGPQMKKMINAYFKGNVVEALEIHNTLMPIFKGLFKTANPILVKEALKIKGIDVGGLRPPLVSASKEQVDSLRADMEKSGIL